MARHEDDYAPREFDTTKLVLLQFFHPIQSPGTLKVLISGFGSLVAFIRDRVADEGRTSRTSTVLGHKVKKIWRAFLYWYRCSSSLRASRAFAFIRLFRDFDSTKFWSLQDIV